MKTTINDLKKLSQKVQKEKSKKSSLTNKKKMTEDDKWMKHLKTEAKKDVSLVLKDIEKQIKDGRNTWELSYWGEKFRTESRYWNFLKEELYKQKFKTISIESYFDAEHGSEGYGDDKWHYHLNIEL